MAVFRSHLVWRWLLAFLALAPVGGAGAELGASADSGAVARREEALKLAARDDTAGLDRAAELLAEASRLDPRSYQARADRALVELLAASARRDEAARLASGDALMQTGRDLRERALEELRPLVREHAGDPAVLRALAVYYGLEGNAEQTERLLERARAAGGSDPWLDFAELAASLRGSSPEKAVAPLAAFAASNPGLLRARMMLALAQLDLSRTDDAIATLDDLLAACPDHDGALKLRARILSPPPARVVVIPAPLSAPPPQLPGNLPRKRSSAGGGAARGRSSLDGTGAER